MAGSEKGDRGGGANWRHQFKEDLPPDNKPTDDTSGLNDLLVVTSKEELIEALAVREFVKRPGETDANFQIRRERIKALRESLEREIYEAKIFADLRLLMSQFFKDVDNKESAEKRERHIKGVRDKILKILQDNPAMFIGIAKNKIDLSTDEGISSFRYYMASGLLEAWRQVPDDKDGKIRKGKIGKELSTVFNIKDPSGFIRSGEKGSYANYLSKFGELDSDEEDP